MRHHLQLIGMALLWGAAWSLAQNVLQYIPPLTAAAIRFSIASIFLLLWIIHHHGIAPIKKLSVQQWSSLTWAATFGVFGYSVFFMYALKYVPAGKASTIVSLNPVPILILGAILYKERINFTICLGMAIAVVGSIITISQGNLTNAFIGGEKLGTYLLLCTLVCWTGYTLIARSKLEHIDPLLVTFATALIGSMLLMIAGLLVEGTYAWHQVGSAPTSMWFSMITLAIGSAALAYLWYFSALKALGVGISATYMVLIPVFGILISSLWLGEKVTNSLIIGGVLVTIGMLLMSWSKKT